MKQSGKYLVSEYDVVSEDGNIPLPAKEPESVRDQQGSNVGQLISNRLNYESIMTKPFVFCPH